MKYSFIAIYIAVFIQFMLFYVLDSNTVEYYEQIDPVDYRYTLLAGKHLFSFFVYYILYILSVITVIIKGRDLPPLTLSLCVIFILIGAILNGVTLCQCLDANVLKDTHWEISYWRLWRNDAAWRVPHYILNIILSFALLIKIIRREKEIAPARQYNNKLLDKINTIIGKHYVVWAFVLLIPVLAIITLILILFGQEKDSMIKLWTETTTWTFSQYEHPPYLEHHGHYLCTVAACGHPRIVKPLRLGKRHGKTIIVNRQLQIANAYEEMIQIRFPRFHRFIRTTYDRYGYPAYKYITNRYLSDSVYILMKPLEYFFLANLYLFDLEPEKRIGKQYC